MRSTKSWTGSWACRSGIARAASSRSSRCGRRAGSPDSNAGFVTYRLEFRKKIGFFRWLAFILLHSAQIFALLGQLILSYETKSLQHQARSWDLSWYSKMQRCFKLDTDSEQTVLSNQYLNWLPSTLPPLALPLKTFQLSMLQRFANIDTFLWNAEQSSQELDAKSSMPCCKNGC